MTNPTDGRWTSLTVFSGRLATSDLLSVVSPGNAAAGINFGLPFANLATNIASSILPNGATGMILFGQGVSTAPAFVPVSGDVLATNNATIATTTIATHAVSFAKFQQVIGLSVVGVAGTATADLAAITASGADQVLRVAPNGTTLGFGPINLTAAALTGFVSVLFGGTGATALALNRVLIGNGTAAIASSNIATTGLPLVGNGTSAAPGFAVLGLSGGGIGTTTLTPFGLVYGNGTSPVGITAAGGVGLPLLGNGTAIQPGFAVLGVVGGGLGTGTTTPFAVLVGGTTATSQVQSIATTGASGLVLTSQGSAIAPIFAAAGAGTVTSVTGAGLATGAVATSGSITVTGASRANQTAAISTTVAVTPAVQQDHDSACKVWAAVNGTTAVIQSSYNVLSIGHPGAGNFTINFLTPFAAATYASVGNVMITGGTSGFVEIGARTATTVQLFVFTATSVLFDPDAFSIQCFGRQ